MNVLERLMYRECTDDGFTLLELLVVVIIIGILAGISIPVFLSQRQKGYDATAINDLRSLAGLEEVYLSDFSTYGTIAQIAVAEPQLRVSKSVTLTVVKYDVLNGYCLSAKHAGSANTWWYDSQAGGVQPKGTAACTITVGVVGDSLTG
jgi:type IV pilus assembly protein PilA